MITAVFAHPAYKGVIIAPVTTPSTRVSLEPEERGGSMIATRGWTRVRGLQGQIDLIADAHDRLYVYGDGVSIDNGATQPVHLKLGQFVRLTGNGGTTVEIAVRAVQGACFLVDLRAEV